MSNKLQWDRPNDILDLLSQLQKLGENSFNPINLRKNDIITRTFKSKKAQEIVENSIKEHLLKDTQNDHTIYISVINKLNETDITKKMIINVLSNIKTKKYKILLLIKIGWNLIDKRLSKELIFHIYIAIKLEYSNTPEENKQEVDNFLGVCNKLMPNLIELQMNHFSEYIYPKDLFNTELPTLDDWQKLLLTYIDENKNVLLVAPTSAGKTNLAVHVVEVSEKVLFIVPTDAVARQVAGMLLNLKYSVALLTSRETIIQNNNYKVMVGTPIEIENYIISNTTINFSYIICDEIHHIGAKEITSSSFERLLKGINASLLAMSATVGNPEVIKLWLEKIKETPFYFINHKKRFINQQKHLFINDIIVSLHPLSTIEPEYLNKYGFTSTITFTAKDLYKLYKDTNLECFSPHTYFKDSIIKMKDLLDFEEYCKDTILKIIKTQNILEKFKINNNIIKVNNYLDIITNIFKNKMYPALIFTNSYKECMDTYKNIINILETEEEKMYPFYKENNKIRFEQYQEYIKEKQKLIEKIQIPKECTNSHDFLLKIEQDITETFVDKLHNTFKQLISNRIKKIDTEKEMSLEEKNRLKLQCKTDLNVILKVENMSYVDPYRPHPDFTYTSTITSDKMRKLKNRLCKALEQNIDYTHTFLRGLERGIIVYHSQLQTPFQNEIQTLIIQKEVNFIIADESLGAGINMPIKTVVLLSNDFSNWDYNKAQQMCGRSGRRGIDREGHIIYAGSNWKNIIANPAIDITGADIISNITLLPKFIYEHPNISYITNCYKITLNEFINNKQINVNRIDTYNVNRIKHKNLIWKLRYINNCLLFDTIFDDIKNISKHYDLCVLIHKNITGKNDTNIYRSLKDNIIIDDSLLPFKLRFIGVILIHLYNYINEINRERKFVPLIVKSFDVIKRLLFKFDKTF